MKKTLIALAALAATAAFAQSSVSITGGMRLGVAKFADGSTGLATTQGSGNTINFTVVEDLGGGLAAEGAVQYRYDMGNGNLTRTGFHTTRVGLKGGFGAIQMGRIGLDQHWGYTGFGATNAGAAVMPVGHLGATENNQIRYISPNIAGFQAHLAQSFKNDGGATFNGGASNGQQILLSYANGPFTALYVNEVLGEQPTAFTTTTYNAAVASNVQGAPIAHLFPSGSRGSQLGASYDMGVAKINVISGLLKTQDGSPSSRNAFTVSATVPMGAMTFKAALKNDRATASTANVGTTLAPVNNTYTPQDVTALGIDYAFSKRTVAEVVTWKYADAKANFWVGMRHSF